MEEDCLKETRCANCRQNYPVYARSCEAYKKEILEVKHKRNVSFQEARKIVGTFMGENSYASVARRADTINQYNRYRVLVGKLIPLEPNDWPKFQEQLKNLYWAVLQTQPRAVSVYKEKASVTTKVKSPTNNQTNATAQTQTTPPKRKSPAKLNSHRSLIRPPSSKLDNQNLEMNCDKLEGSPQSKMDYAPSLTERERLKGSILPKETAETKIRFNLRERMEREVANGTRTKKKNNPNPP